MKKSFTLFCFLLLGMTAFSQTRHFVTANSNFFMPASLTVTAGDTVQWDNSGGFHNVNGTTATFASNPEGFTNGSASSSSWTYEYVFTMEGTYDYQCDPHSGLGMVGTITVEAAPATVPDLVITEINYNNPGTDDFEFIEIYNNDSEAVNLENYSFSEGVEFTFPAMMIQPGQYLVTALNADDMFNNFGVTALEWTDGNLVNSSETITLVDSNNEIVDQVTYDDGAPWAEIADGEGPSLVLCDVNADNSVAQNWSYSTTNTSVTFGFIETLIFASPGFANSSCTDVPYVYVEGTNRIVDENEGSFNVTVNLAAIGMMDTTDVTFTVSGSATEGTDFTLGALTFGVGSSGPGDKGFANLSVDITDDMDEEDTESFDLVMTMATNGVIIGANTITITINDNDGLVYNAYDIGTVTTNNAVGVADSLDVVCEIQGIVHGVDMNGGTSVQFTTIDATGGIGLFSGNDYGYTVVEGDEVIIRGSISQFNGLTQISPDTIILVSQGNDLVVPPVVTALDESTESELVRINGLTIVDASQWTGAGSGFNVDVTDGTNTYAMRIDNDVDLYSMPAPVGEFDLIGLGGQFDNSEPFDGGYQLLPRYMPDVIQGGSNEISAVDDSYSIDLNQEVNLEVLGNDNTPNGVMSLVIEDMPTLGSIDIQIDNSLNYTPDMDACGVEQFTYIICDNTAACDTATVTIDIECPASYPIYPISTVSSTDQDGVADSLGVSVQISGIVYGVDLQGNDNIQFTIIDATDSDGGIGLFSSNDFGYTVNEGDEVVVQGAISQFNGLTQISPDTLWMLSSGNGLHDAEVVTGLSESTESKLIKFENMSFVDPMEWTGMGSGFNVDITDGTNTVTMRIDNDVDLYAMTIPGFPTFNVTGIGGQFDNENPFDSGYQFLPRYVGDIEEVVSVIDPTISEDVSFFPNPVERTLYVSLETSMESLKITNVLGQQVMNIENPQNREEINVSNLASGIYVLTFTTNDRIWSTQFVKQ